MCRTASAATTSSVRLRLPAATCPRWRSRNSSASGVETVFTTYTNANQRHALSHEFGHTLGHYHLTTCDSVMSEGLWLRQPWPTAQDVANP